MNNERTDVNLVTIQLLLLQKTRTGSLRVYVFKSCTKR